LTENCGIQHRINLVTNVDVRLGRSKNILLCLTASAVVEALLLAKPVAHSFDVSPQACNE
jgi:hypothetical protein